MTTNTFVDRKAALSQWGASLRWMLKSQEWNGYEMGIEESIYNEFKSVVKLANVKNPWFTEKMIYHSLSVWADQLTEKNIDYWLSNYSIPTHSSSKSVLLILAGNLPMVGWHDFICCYLLGFKLKIKLSKSDDVIIPFMIKLLSLFSINLMKDIEVVDGKVKDYDVVIATGSNNTNRYFDFYFGKKPHLFRKNRTSIAVIDNSTTENNLNDLSKDVFDYFGLGCRSVTKLYIEKGVDVNSIFKSFYHAKEVMNHVKYMNNYDYNKAIYLLEDISFLDNGFMILRENKNLHSPVSVVNYEYFDNIVELNEKLKYIEDEIQCRVGVGGIPCGTAQNPSLSDYADGVDTIQFLINNLN